MYYFSHNNQSVHKNLSGIKFNVIEPILEKLLVILNSINFEYEQISFIEEIIGFKNNNEPTEEPLFFTETDIENIKYIFNIIKQFLSRVPLTKIFQYFKQNLLYKPNKLNLKSDFLTIYKNLKRNETDILWDKHYEKLLEKNRKRLITELFGEYNFDTLENFNLNLSNMINKSSNVKIRFVKKINILTEFITNSIFSVCALYKTLFFSISLIWSYSH